jgi:general transcription factor 3C polypeptide 3 (transcription factor C subunit 4)
LGDEVVEDERRVDDDDDAPGILPHAGQGQGQVKKKKGGGRKSGVAQGRESTAAAAVTLGDALEMDEDGLPLGEADGEGEGEDEDTGLGDEGDVKKELARPTKVSPAWSAIYGQYMLSSASHHGALCTSFHPPQTETDHNTDYLLRAYELDPYDPYICFMITQAFFGRAMNRQSDNRNYQIAQVCLIICLRRNSRMS